MAKRWLDKLTEARWLERAPGGETLYQQTTQDTQRIFFFPDSGTAFDFAANRGSRPIGAERDMPEFQD